MKPRILVVDNDADMVALLRRHLEGEGWAVTAVTGAGTPRPRSGARSTRSSSLISLWNLWMG
jgi:CheY-like chemotaxis protein